MRLQQLAANGQPPIWDDMHTLQLMKAEEDDEAQRSTRAQGLKKQQEQKKESEAQTRSAWFDEVRLASTSCIQRSVCCQLYQQISAGLDLLQLLMCDHVSLVVQVVAYVQSVISQHKVSPS